MKSGQIEERHFIEDMGLFCEQTGLTRMAGRILGVLLISDPEDQSLNDICDALGVSKSAVSTTTRMLMNEGLVEQVPSPVPRRDYYRFRKGGWMGFLRKRMEILAAIHDITDRGLALLDGKDDSLKSRLNEAHEVFEFVDSEFPGWMAKLESRSARR